MSREALEAAQRERAARAGQGSPKQPAGGA
jgi:hypothetical protein